MKVLSLFSGVGGFDLGLENAGMETVFQCEWDKHATSILERHWPDTPRWGDITTLTGEHILAHAPVIDVVAWGSPCQDLSVAGKRAGLEGSRSGLFHQGIRIINELRKATNNVYPRISIWENVYGALNSNKGSDFGVILDEMAEAGSLVQEWRVLDAQYFGVPQRRRRVFLISVFNSAIAANCPDPLLPVCEGVRWDSATSRTARQEPAGTVTDSFASGSQWPAGSDQRGVLRQSVSSKWSKGSSGPSGDEYMNMVVRNPILIDRAAFNQGTNAHYDPIISDHPVTPSLVARGPHAVATHTVVEPLLIDGTRVDDVRIYDPPVQTLKERMGTGGNNVPVILGAATNDQTGAQAVAIGIQGNVIGRQDHNGPAGKGHTEEGDPMFTLTGTDIHAVAYTMRMREGKPGGGKGPLISEEKSLTLGAATNDQTIFQPNPLLSFDTNFDSNANVFENQSPTLKASQAAPSVMQYDGYNQRIHEDDVSVTPRLGRLSSDFVAQPTEVVGTLRSGGDGGVPSSRGEHLVTEPTMSVRRLTPLECERLMGWPDRWTETKADGTPQADTHRYKQCGNGVASPVAQWIGQQLLQLDKEHHAPPTTTTT